MKSINQTISLLSNSAFYGNKYRLLKTKSLELFHIFLEKNWHKNKNDFEFNVNRYFIDQKDKPKDWTMVCELLSVINNMRFT